MCRRIQVRHLYDRSLTLHCCRVGIELSTVEVRFQDLEIETSVFVGSRALPSVTNRLRDYIQASLTQ